MIIYQKWLNDLADVAIIEAERMTIIWESDTNAISKYDRNVQKGV